MSSTDDDAYVDDAYDEEYDDTYEGVTEESDADSFFPAAGFPYGWPPGIFGSSTREEYDEDAYDADAYEEDEGWWDEGLVGMLLVGGAILFFVPEPATTTIGIIMMVTGVAVWVADALT